MKKNKLLIALAILACSSAVMANDDITYSFGLKSWHHNLKIDSNSASTASSIVSATARKGDYFVATSFLLPTVYSFSDSYIKRKDTDFAVGYALNSNFSALLGNKRIGVDSSDSSSTIKMSYLGLNAFTPVGESSFVFGQVTRSIKVTDTSITDGSKTTFSFTIEETQVVTLTATSGQTCNASEDDEEESKSEN